MSLKKLLAFSSIFFGLSGSAFSQTDQGVHFWSGSLNGLANRYKADFDRGITAPYYNYSVYRLSAGNTTFVRDNWALGAAADFSYSRSRGGYGVIRSDQHSPSLSAYLRRYWGEGQWRIFAGGGLSASYNLSLYSQPVGPSVPEEKSTTRQLAIQTLAQVGGIYFVNNRLGLEVVGNATAFPFSLSSVGVGLVWVTQKGISTMDQVADDSKQTQKGNVILSAFTDFNGSTNREGAQNPTDPIRRHSNQVNISPAIGWFVRTNTLVGINTIFSLRSDKSNIPPSNGSFKRTESYRSTTVGIGPYLKKYWTPWRLKPFVGGAASFQLTTSRNQFITDSSPVYETSSRSRSRSVTVGASAGLSYLIGNRFMIETTLADLTVLRTVQAELPANRNWTYQGVIGFQPSFTIQYVFQ